MSRRVTVIVAMLLLVLASCGEPGAQTVTVTHAPPPAPTYLDHGDEGPSVGDVRVFHFDAATSDGETVSTDWTMTTTAIDVPEPGVEVRIATGVFSFGRDGDQLVLQGSALYPGEDAVIEVDSTTVRSIIGGAGRFAGASGWVESEHLQDGTWRHTFHLD